MRKAWKPTGKVFTDVGYKWKPTGRFFTIVGNSCPLTRITPKKIVHLKETTSKSVETPKPEIKVYSRRPKQIKSVGSSKKAKIVESKIANNSEPTHLWGSNATDVPSSSSLVNDRLSRSSSGSHDINLYTISLDNMLKTSQMCLLSKASKTKSWLRHRRLSHLNFGTLNKLAKDGLAQGIPKLKFQKDHLCSTCALGKSKKSSHQPKAEDTNQEKLYILHMDLCGPMRVESINRKKVYLVRNIRTDKGTEFVNQTLRDFYENVGISHQTLVARTPQQNDIVERRNRTLVEAARTMLIFSKSSSVSMGRSNQHSLLHPKPFSEFEDLGKLNAKVDIGIFIGYMPAKKAFRIYNRRTQKIMETIHVTFDELTAMASEQFGSGPGLQVMTPATSSSGLVPNIIPQQPCNPPKRDDWDSLFQPLFDEYFNPPTIVVSTVLVAIAPRAIEIADSPVSTSINQDAPSSSIPLSQDQEHSLIISQGVEESP
ncbi:retrovirus-related pol polyprotein from transposon TNT 1-94, partial [Tanacetum coccineum]